MKSVALAAKVFLGLFLFSSAASASPITIHVSVTNATLYGLNGPVQGVPDFSVTVLLDLGAPNGFHGVDSQGSRATAWEPPTSLTFATDSPYEQQLLGYAGPAGHVATSLSAVAAENIPRGAGRVSEGFLRSVAYDGCCGQYGTGLFLMELFGQSVLGDLPTVDAANISDGYAFVSFLNALDSLTFGMTGYSIGPGGGIPSYGIVYGDAHIGSVSPVPEPGSLVLFGSGAIALAWWRRRHL